jgi:hypothetical protein
MSWKETAAAIYAAALALLHREGRPRIERGISICRTGRNDSAIGRGRQARPHPRHLAAGRLELSMPKMPDGETNAERENPGELIHLDIKKLGRIGSVGHRITGRYRGAVNHHNGISGTCQHRLPISTRLKV